MTYFNITVYDNSRIIFTEEFEDLDDDDYSIVFQTKKSFFGGIKQIDLTGVNVDGPFTITVGGNNLTYLVDTDESK